MAAILNFFNWLHILSFLTGERLSLVKISCLLPKWRNSPKLPDFRSIIQGSAIGPVSYVVTAADLTTTVPGNSLFKYADDTYIIVPANNVDTRSCEVNNVESWAKANKLTLNRSKSVEIVFTTKRKRQFTVPPLLPGITRVTALKMLGVTISDKLSVSDHIQNIVSSCAQSVHAIRTLRAHGMSQEAL